SGRRHAPSSVTTTTDGFAPLAIHLFGPVDVVVRGERLAQLRTRKVGWLLALLALRGGREIERAWLAALLWPDSAVGAGTLRRSLNDVRRVLGTEAGRLQGPTHQSLRLDLTDAFVDVLAFDRAIAWGDLAALEQAVSLYRRPFLEGCDEEWAVA